MYNNAAGGSISVGEYWDSSYDNVWNWVKGTNYNSMAFDFPGKYAALNNGLASSNYDAMAWLDGSTKRPAGLIHSTSSRLTTRLITQEASTAVIYHKLMLLFFLLPVFLVYFILIGLQTKLKLTA